RLCLPRYNATELGNVPFSNLFYSEALGLLIAQQGGNLYSTPGNGTWTIFPSMPLTSARRCGCCGFPEQLLGLPPDDGVQSFNGSAFSARVANSPNGSMIVPWQNYLV